MKVKVTYCINYNGALIEVDDVAIDDWNDPKAEAVMNKVVDFAYGECDDDGDGEITFCGDINQVKEVATDSVKEIYGPDVEVEFEVDSSSS